MLGYPCVVDTAARQAALLLRRLDGAEVEMAPADWTGAVRQVSAVVASGQKVRSALN